MSQGYGWKNRPAVQPAVQLQRVPPGTTDPRTYEPRSVDAAVRDAGAGATLSFFQLQYAMQCDGTRLVAATNLNATATGGGGAVVNTDRTWYSRIGRFCRKSVMTHSAGAIGTGEERVGLDLSLFALISTAAPRAPWVLRFEDVLSAEMSGSGTISGAVHFGLRQNNGGAAAMLPAEPFIGFICNMVAPGYATWAAYVCGDGGAGAVSTNTGISTEDPHLLTVDIDGGDGTITFYIDGAQVAQVSGFASALTHTSDDGGVSWMVLGSGSGVHTAVVTVGYWMDLQANISVRVLDEAA